MLWRMHALAKAQEVGVVQPVTLAVGAQLAHAAYPRIDAPRYLVQSGLPRLLVTY